MLYAWYLFIFLDDSTYSCLTDLSNTEIMTSVNLSFLDLSTLKIATENFAERNKLGQGGFGVVYKVRIYLILSYVPFQCLTWKDYIFQLLSVKGKDNCTNNV